MRARPDIESNRIGIIPRNETLSVLDEKTGADGKKWYKVKLYENREGWIAAMVVKPKQ